VVITAPFPPQLLIFRGFLAVTKTMDTKYFDEYLQQLKEWQDKFFETWANSFPDVKEGVKLPENTEKALQFQEDLVSSYLEVQKKTTDLLLNSQKQFWNQYFDVMKKTTADLVN
jgi:hypothetical protein